MDYGRKHDEDMIDLLEEEEDDHDNDHDDDEEEDDDDDVDDDDDLFNLGDASENLCAFKNPPSFDLANGNNYHHRYNNNNMKVQLMDKLL